MYKYIPETRMQASPGLISTFFLLFLSYKSMDSILDPVEHSAPPLQMKSPIL